MAAPPASAAPSYPPAGGADAPRSVSSTRDERDYTRGDERGERSSSYREHERRGGDRYRDDRYRDDRYRDDRYRDDRHRDDRYKDDRYRDDRYERRERHDRRDDWRDDRAARGGGSRRERSPSPRDGLTEEERALEELTRTARTVLVSQLVSRATERDVRQFFEAVGPVAEVALIRDKSGRSKGLAYVEFKELQGVSMSLLLNGQKFCMQHPACTCSGLPIVVKRSEVEKNFNAMAEAAGGSALSANAERRVYLGNLPRGMNEGDVRSIGATVGLIDKVMVNRDSRGEPTGTAYITYSTADLAKQAIGLLNNFEVGGHVIKAGKMNPLGEVDTPDGSSFRVDTSSSGALSAQARAALAMQLASMTAQAAQQIGINLLAANKQPMGAGAGAAVAPIMQTTTLPPTAMIVAGGADAASRAASATPCILIKNMFDPATETEATWVEDIQEEVKEECAKYGKVLHAHVVKESQGHVYMMFADVAGAMAATSALHGRMYAGRSLQVVPVPITDYINRYPEVASLV